MDKDSSVSLISVKRNLKETPFIQLFFCFLFFCYSHAAIVSSPPFLHFNCNYLTIKATVHRIVYRFKM